MLEAGWMERFAPGRPPERRQYWTIPPYEPRPESLDEAAERLRGVLEESIALHAFADAPVGAFLSGGVDSTGIVALMRKHLSNLRTYTLHCPDVGHQDETAQAAATARRFDCINTVVEIRGQEMPQLLPQFAAAMDQPTHDGLNTWLISRAAARDVKATLSGVGGDEWFAGYSVTRRMAFYQHRWAGRLQQLAGRVVTPLEPRLSHGKLRARIGNLATRRSSLATWLQAHRVFQDDVVRRAVGLPGLGFDREDWYRSHLGTLGADLGRETPVGLSCLLDSQIYLGCQLLPDSDVMSMAHSLELRTPFVDIEIAKFSRTCRDDFKLNLDGEDRQGAGRSGAKRVLIRALGDLLPADLGRRPKLGFALPYSQWLRGELRPLLMETCSGEALAARGLLDPRVLAPLTGSPAAISSNLHPRLWTLMLLELWCRSVLDVPAQQAVPTA